MAALVNPYYDGGLAQSPDFSKYQVRNRSPYNQWNVDPDLDFGKQQRVSSYGNYQGRQLDLNAAPQESPTTTGDVNYPGLVSGALSLGLNAYGMGQQRLNLSKIPSMQQDPNAPPAYTAGQLENEIATAHPKGAQAGEVLSGAASGAATGSAFGLPGTVIGAGIGALSSVIGGDTRKHAEQRQLQEAEKRVRASQSLYNQADVNYRAHQNQLFDYYNRNNAQGREYNVYKSRFSY